MACLINTNSDLFMSICKRETSGFKATDPQKPFDQWSHERKSIGQLKEIRLSKHVS